MSNLWSCAMVGSGRGCSVLLGGTGLSTDDWFGFDEGIGG